MTRKLAAAAALFAAVCGAHADTLLSEGFENVAGLPAAGWVQTNLSSPVGLPWGQGFVGPFAAQAGTANSYAVANFESAAFGSGGVIDNWLITPVLNFGASNTVSFWTRTIFNPSIFPDRLELRLSLGSGADTASFTTLLVSVNPELTQTGYPNAWTMYSATFDFPTPLVPVSIPGRLAFRYTVPNSFNADFIGLDTVTVTSVPEPQAVLLMGAGLAALLSVRRRARSS
jgi:PEP-CTERM motif